MGRRRYLELSDKSGHYDMSSNQWSNKKTKHKTPAHQGQAKVDVDSQCCVGVRYLSQVFGQGAGNQGPSHTDQKSCNFLC